MVETSGDTAWVVQRHPFSFTVPHNLISPCDDVDPNYLRLPPSAKLGFRHIDWTAGKKYMQPLIMYTLEASLTAVPSDSALRICRYHGEKEIEIQPCREASPPLDVADYPGDFQLCAKSCLRTRTLKGGIGALYLSATEPAALVVNTESPRATTVATARLHYLPGAAARQSGWPYEWSCEVSTSIRSTTFYSTRKTTKMQTLCEASQFPCGAVRIDDLDSETRILSPLAWRQNHLASNGGVRLEERNLPWVTTLSIPVSASKCLLPTFATEFASRRYALVLRVRMRGIRHRVLDVEVPLQVIREPPKQDSVVGDMADELSMDQSFESEMKPPQYRQYE